MKATINIAGQTSGNFTLLNALLRNSFPEHHEDGMFYSKRVIYKTKKEARKALWAAYKDLRSDYETRQSLRYRAGDAIFYDASKAELQ